MKLIGIAAVAAGVALVAGGAKATEFVTNGGFESSTYVHNTQFGASYGGQGVTGWTGAGHDGSHQRLEFYYLENPTSENATNEFGDSLGYLRPSFTPLSATSGAFVALDGDEYYSGLISQTITGLTAGHTYNLSFDWGGGQLANRTGPFDEQLHVGFGGSTFDTGVLNVASEGFSGWKHVTTSFKADGASQILSFLSVSGTKGLPPIATLDNVSLTGGVPEPATWSMMIIGFGGLGAMMRRRRSVAATA